LGQSEQILKQMVAKFGKVTNRTLGKVDHDLLRKCNLYDDIQEVYKSLNGSQDIFPINNKNTWDIEFDGVAIEFDEHLHFNRYRLITLGSHLYRKMPEFPWKQYQEYCVIHEKRCIKAGSYGGKWTNKSAERQFNNSPPPGQFVGAGPSRWRQRAFYDFLKDATPFSLKFPVVRLAIWDKIEIEGQCFTIGSAIKNPNEKIGTAIYNLIKERQP
jgi:hypothetical protein